MKTKRCYFSPLKIPLSFSIFQSTCVSEDMMPSLGIISLQSPQIYAHPIMISHLSSSYDHKLWRPLDYIRQ